MVDESVEIENRVCGEKETLHCVPRSSQIEAPDSSCIILCDRIATPGYLIEK